MHMILSVFFLFFSNRIHDPFFFSFFFFFAHFIFKLQHSLYCWTLYIPSLVINLSTIKKSLINYLWYIAFFWAKFFVFYSMRWAQKLLHKRQDSVLEIQIKITNHLDYNVKNYDNEYLRLMFKPKWKPRFCMLIFQSGKPSSDDKHNSIFLSLFYFIWSWVGLSNIY